MGTQDTSLESASSHNFNMTFWQENYPFIKDVYLMRQTKMVELMENVEKAISRIMADKVYTSAEFKRERDNFHALCKDLERAEIKKWLQQILEILMAERGKDERSDNTGKLDVIIAKHEELIPTVLKTQVKVDLNWKPKGALSKTSSLRAKYFLRTQTNLSSWTAMLAALNKVGMRPKKKPLPGLPF